MLKFTYALSNQLSHRKPFIPTNSRDSSLSYRQSQQKSFQYLKKSPFGYSFQNGQPQYTNVEQIVAANKVLQLNIRNQMLDLVQYRSNVSDKIMKHDKWINDKNKNFVPNRNVIQNEIARYKQDDQKDQFIQNRDKQIQLIQTARNFYYQSVLNKNNKNKPNKQNNVNRSCPKPQINHAKDNNKSNNFTICQQKNMNIFIKQSNQETNNKPLIKTQKPYLQFNNNSINPQQNVPNKQVKQNTNSNYLKKYENYFQNLNYLQSKINAAINNKIN